MKEWLVKKKDVLISLALAIIIGFFLVSIGIKYSQPTGQEKVGDLKFRSLD